MPLASGASHKSFAGNISELMKSFAKTGRIGNSKPASKAKANKQAVAIAFRKQREAKTIAHG
jgi:hypothetical protein